MNHHGWPRRIILISEVKSYCSSGNHSKKNKTPSFITDIESKYTVTHIHTHNTKTYPS